MSIFIKNQAALFLTVFSLFLIPKISLAQTPEIQETNEPLIYSLNMNSAAVQRGYTASIFEDKFTMGIFPEVLNKETKITFKDFKNYDESTFPENQTLISDVFEFDILNPDSFSNKKPLILEIKYNQDSPFLKVVHYWNKDRQAWVPLPTRYYPTKAVVRSVVHLPYARLAVFADKDIQAEGKASWYKYKNCDCAASTDYPKGTLLRVTNIKNNQAIIVKVNDYGPEKKIHPDRVVDLDKFAFKKIAKLGGGIINVTVEPLYIEDVVNVYEEKKLGSGARAGIILDGKTGDILWSKNVNQVLPIASLTKLVTVGVFLDFDVPWDNKIIYKKEYDADGAKIKVKPGDEITVSDLFFATLVSSANNAAKALAHSTGLTEEEFVRRMNQKAKDLGLTATYFVEPTGLSHGNKSTAKEYAVLAANILNNPKILEGTTTKAYNLKINGGAVQKIKNTNQLLISDLSVTGGKTGYTEEAGYCLVTKAEGKYNSEVVALVLGEKDESSRFRDVERMLRWGLNELTKKAVSI